MMHVSLIVLERALASSITIPLEMLYAARTLSQVTHGNNQDLVIDTVALQTKPVTMAGGITILPTAELDNIAQTDLVIVPGMWGSMAKTLRKSTQLIDWLKLRHNEGSTICSIVTGSFFLAEAGLLNNRSATTHWYHFNDFQNRYPKVKLDKTRFITSDSGIYCTGSVNAARDVTLHLVANLFGDTIASEIAKHFTHEIARSYESLLLSSLRQDTHHDELIIEIQAWLQKNYPAPIQIASVAREFRLSVRSLNRRFKAAADVTPLQYLQEVRISEAKQLLKKSNLTIAEVCYAVGYQDANYFSGVFKKINKVTPAEYRQLVRSKLFKVGDQE